MPIDRISSLPDELLINILNFLPTNYAVTTCILSRRWSYLFTEVTNLDFDDSFLFNSQSALNREKSCVAFRDFICKALACLKLSNLIGFRIKCSYIHEVSVLESVGLWLGAILNRGIQEIDLCIAGCCARDVIPHSLFTCKTLCILKLTCGYTAVLDIPGAVCLPCLKILYLHDVTVLDVDLISRISSGCPLLEEFDMEMFNWYETNQLSISAPCLRKLKLSNRKVFDIYPKGATCHVAIVAPLLQSFHFADKLVKSYSIKTSNYLVEAYLDIFVYSGDFKDSTLSHTLARDLIQGVSNVKRLFLSTDSIKALTCVRDDFPILRNLAKLKIGCSMNPHLTLLRLLRNAPNLEELIFSEGIFPDGFKDYDTEQHDYWGRGQVVPSCLKTRLQVIEIESFVGLEEELRIVEYFLSNSHVLEQLIIRKCVGRKEKFKVRKQLKMVAKRLDKSVMVRIL